MLRIQVLTIAVLILAGCRQAEETRPAYTIAPIDIKYVTLTDSFWLPRIKLIQDTTIKHSFEKCEAEGRMENFFIAGGKKRGTTKGAMPFDDTDLYKIIEGASYSLVSHPNPKLETYLDSIISIIKVGQEPDGYLTTWFTIDRTKPPANWVAPSTERWENEITSHELYNSGHLFEAAAAHHRATGKKNMLDIALKNADLLVANFGPGKLQKPPGHQIVETGLIKLYEITGKKEYLDLAKGFVDWRGDSTTHKLYGAYNQDHIPVVNQSNAVGHAVRAEYLYAAMADISAFYNDPAYKVALERIWDNVVNKKTYVTGGVGARHDGEAFGDDYELPNLEAYNETCAAIGSVAWNQKMFMLSGDIKYYDILERTLYNGLISGMSTDGKLFFYPNPLELDGKFEFNKGSCTRQSWFDCSCCPTNLVRFIPSLPSYIYASQGDVLYTNLFISSKVQFNNGTLTQETGYPWNGNVKFKAEGVKSFTLKVRVPGWLRNEVMPGNLYSYVDLRKKNAPLLFINGKEEPVVASDGYITITREWKPTDVVEVKFPMEIREVTTNRPVGDNKNKVALERGPIVYALEEIDNGKLDNVVLGTDAGIVENSKTLLNEHVITLDGKGQYHFIPYYLWSNRGVGQMKVWIPRAN